MDGLQLSFHLAGINNQNFLMRDDQTGSFWQQIDGLAISGPLAGRHLTLVHSDELTLSLFKREQPAASILKDVPAYVSDYSPQDWDIKMRTRPTVVSYAAPGVEQRDLMLGIASFGAARAFPYNAVVKQKLVKDRVGNEPLILVLGPDEKSVRAFRARVGGTPSGFYRLTGDPSRDKDSPFMDDLTGSRWNFQGCAIDGKAKGSCLERVEITKDYWFDWRNYHPDTSIYKQ